MTLHIHNQKFCGAQIPASYLIMINTVLQVPASICRLFKGPLTVETFEESQFEVHCVHVGFQSVSPHEGLSANVANVKFIAIGHFFI